MIRAQVSEIAGWLRLAPPLCSDPVICGVSTDTRDLRAGNLFVALRGARYDGHAFAAEAEARGASALMVGCRVASDLPQLVVKDTAAGLGESSSKSGVTQLETEPGIVDTIVERLLPIRYSGPWSLSAEADERLAGSNAFVGA